MTGPSRTLPLLVLVVGTAAPAHVPAGSGEARQQASARPARTPGNAPDHEQDAGFPGRDPFRLPDAAPEAPRPAGLAGIRIAEAQIRGVLLFPRGRYPAPRSGLAIIASATGSGFVVAPGERLMDGVVSRIVADGVVFRRAGDPATAIFLRLAGSGPEPGGAE